MGGGREREKRLEGDIRMQRQRQTDRGINRDNDRHRGRQKERLITIPALKKLK